MPEGFTSIADLKVVVDASTEKLAGNLQLAQNVVKRFSDESNQHLGLFDRAVGNVGNGVSMLIGKANVWYQAFQMISGVMSDVRAKGDQLAAMGGAQDEWSRIIAAYDDMVASVQEGTQNAVLRAVSSIGDYFTASKSVEQANDGIVQSGQKVDTAHVKTAEVAKLTATEVAEGMNELSRLSRHTADEVTAANQQTAWSFENIRKSAVDAVIGGMDRVSHEFKTMADQATWSAETIEKQIAIIAAHAEELKRRIADVQAGGFDPVDVFNGDNAVKLLREQMEGEFRQIEALSAAHMQKLKEIDDAARAEREDAASTQFETAVQGIEREIRALEDKAGAYGLTKGEAAGYAAVMKLINELTAKESSLTEEAAEKLGELTDRIKALTDQEEARTKAKTNADAGARFMQSLDAELRTLNQQYETLGMSTAAVAAYNAEARLRNQLADQHLQLSASDRATAEAKIQRIRDEAEAIAVLRASRQDEAQDQKTFDGAILNLQRQTLALNAKLSALHDNSEAGRINALVEQQLSDLKARGVDITDARTSALRREAEAQVDAAIAMEQAQRQLDILKGYAGTVTSSLEGAFRKWTDGAKLSVKDMVASMLSDMAQLTFRRGVTENLMSALFGGAGNSGGGLLSGLFGGGGGGWQTSVQFAGYRADGGPVDAGKMYMVGERGPEPFIPSVPGTILPNGALGGSVSVTLHTSVDARGATEGTAAQIERALAARDAQLPGQITSAVQTMKDRGQV